jgi:hypothetical protein
VCPLTNPKRKKSDLTKPVARLQSYAIWSGLVFQMAALVIAGLLAGRLVNRLTGDTGPMAEMVGVLTGVIAAIAFAIRFVITTNKKPPQ